MMNIKVGVIFLSAVSCSTQAIVLKDYHSPICMKGKNYGIFEFMMPVVLGICLCVGYIIKKWIKDVDNKYIPTICGVLGIVLAAWINGFAFSPEIVLSGLISGLASTGLHQALTQFIEKKEPKTE